MLRVKDAPLPLRGGMCRKKYGPLANTSQAHFTIFSNEKY
jgi:hypothetical protein